MTVFDMILGGLLGYGLYKGIKNGLFVELASFVSLLVGIYFAVKFSYVMKVIISKWVSWNPGSIQVAAFVLTFVVVVVGLYFSAKMITKLADFAYLGWINKIGGGFFRVLKTVLVLSVVFAVFEKINYNNIFAKEETLDNSLFYRPIQKVARFVYPSIDGFYETLKSKKEATPEKE